MQGEYIQANVDTTFGGDATFDGYYILASYLLTGENRVYKNNTGVFASPVPKHNFSFKGKEPGWGAWELAARFASVDLNDSLIRGGEHESITLGLNWYLNPNIRVFWNYIHNEVEHDRYRGELDSFQTRIPA